MNDLIWIIAIVAVWFVLNRFILPRLGMDT
jgi:hypothetical protein